MFRAIAIAVLLLAPVNARPAHHRTHVAQRCDAIGIMYVRCIWKDKR